MYVVFLIKCKKSICRTLPDQYMEQVVAQFKKYGIQAVLVIGGFEVIVI